MYVAGATVYPVQFTIPGAAEGSGGNIDNVFTIPEMVVKWVVAGVTF